MFIFHSHSVYADIWSSVSEKLCTEMKHQNNFRTVPESALIFILASTLSNYEHFVLLGIDVEVGLFLHAAICQNRAVWQDVQPDVDLHCVIEVSSFSLRWQMDTLYNVFGTNARRQTACVQGSAGDGREYWEADLVS